MSEKELFPAHIRITDDSEEVQSVQEHCMNTAQYAADTLKDCNLFHTAYLAGLLHDMGKFKQEFKEYIEKSAHNEPVTPGSVNHTFAGVRYILETFHCSEDLVENLTAEVIAYVIGGHHGLFDCLDEYGASGFEHRMSKPHISFEESLQNCIDQFNFSCLSEEETFDVHVKRHFSLACEEIRKIVGLLYKIAPQDENLYPPERLTESYFYLHLLTRLVLSAVIEGDRKDTAQFMTGDVEPVFYDSLDKMWAECLHFAKQQHHELVANAKQTPINVSREEITRQCLKIAEKGPGIYRFKSPTGSGKTETCSLATLAHANNQGKSRIIFTFPLLSILDQNAKVIRKNIPKEEYVLEHHSNVVRSQSSEDELDYHELLAETWHAPIIVTTLVQFLNTLFDGKTTSIRRFHSLVNSVIVIDEIQTVPLKMMSLFNLALNFLAEVCGATIILCSATQPRLEDVKHPLKAPIDLVPYDEDLWVPFKRTCIIDAGKKSLNGIPECALGILEEASSLLIVCNKKDEALSLFKQLNNSVDHCFHLSASMCTAHREETLDQLKAALDGIALRKAETACGEGANAGEYSTGSASKTKELFSEKVVCVATQVIEAGVDISFECVIRLAAGMDNVVQAFGRENRNGENAEPAPAYIVNCVDEDLSRLIDIERSKAATVNVLEEFQKHPERFDGDLASNKAIDAYYHNLYNNLNANDLDYPLERANDKTSEESLYSLLSLNAKRLAKYRALHGQETGYELNQSFAEAGKAFEVFDDETTDVVVPYGEQGKTLIAEFNSERAQHDLKYQRQLVEQAKHYSIAIRSYQRKKLEKNGGLVGVCNGLVWVLNTDFYNENYGLELDPQGSCFLEG